MDQLPPILPVLPIRNAVVFPAISMPLVVGRDRSIRAIERARKEDRLILIVAQKNLTSGDPTPPDLYSVGTLCKIESTETTEAGSQQVIISGMVRFRVTEFILDNANYLTARGELVPDIHAPHAARNEALFKNLKELAKEVIELLPGTTEPLLQLIDRLEDSSYLTHVCAAYLNLSVEQKQGLLENVEVESRMEMLLTYMRKEREILSIQRDIREKMSERLSKAQKEALLREQIRTIRTELGEEPGEEVTDELEAKLKEMKLPEVAMKQANEELKRLKNLPPASAEYHVIRTYLEWIAALPWSIKTDSLIDIGKARQILDEDHYGLQDVKKRIVQFLAVAKLKNDVHGPILCLVGPPGVGKTSLGHSIARALGRKFIRTSLGGVRDEAEIRGHRRTYVGAMPGRIIQSIKRAGTRNPVMMLDEIDKLRADFHGDPSSAMLEVLDPEQNKTFVDHYIDIPFDLSDVFFITTANMVDTIPAPLRDRMEIIDLSSYTSIEKLEIAKRYLVPKQLQEHGLTPELVRLPDPTIEKIITYYTREAGVRELQRKIAALFRAVAERFVEREESGLQKEPIDLSPSQLQDLLGPEKFFPELADRIVKPGVATGLAWTPQGGELLFIEVTAMPAGQSHLILTGQLGDVMKESAQIALSLARSLTPSRFRHSFDFNTNDIHIHVPAGSIPKDGPSAGITIFVALTSLLLGQAIDKDLAMTGEITLRGVLLPVGGIKEKVLAAHRGGITRIIIPKKNEPDLLQVPEDVKKQITFTLAATVEEVLDVALPRKEQRAETAA